MSVDVKVKCVNNTGVQSQLTKGKVYDVVGQTRSLYFVHDDVPMDWYQREYGKMSIGFDKERFEIISEKEVMRVKCIRQGNNSYITVGKIYETIGDDGYCYSIINDQGDCFEYAHSLFEIVSEKEEPEVVEEGKPYLPCKNLMKFDPVTGESEPYPSHPDQYRAWHGKVAWLYNPFSGTKRDARDVGSDVFGFLIGE